MSRTVEWSQWQARRKDAVGAQARVSERLGGRWRDTSAPARNEDDIAVITRMTVLEVERRRDEGRLVRLGPREYELRTRQAAQVR